MGAVCRDYFWEDPISWGARSREIVAFVEEMTLACGAGPAPPKSDIGKLGFGRT